MNTTSHQFSSNNMRQSAIVQHLQRPLRTPPPPMTTNLLYTQMLQMANTHKIEMAAKNDEIKQMMMENNARIDNLIKSSQDQVAKFTETLQQVTNFTTQMCYLGAAGLQAQQSAALQAETPKRANPPKKVTKTTRKTTKKPVNPPNPPVRQSNSVSTCTITYEGVLIGTGTSKNAGVNVSFKCKCCESEFVDRHYLIKHFQRLHKKELEQPRRTRRTN